jgi:hypothetical protein
VGYYGKTKEITNAMNEWGLIGQESLVALGKSATINKFKTRRGYVRECFLIPTHHSLALPTIQNP